MNRWAPQAQGVHPNREEFAALARDWTIVPVWCELLADLTTPVAAYARLVRGEPGFVLESVEHAGTWGRWSFIGRRPSATMTLRHGRVSVEVPSRSMSRRTAGSWPPSRPYFLTTGHRRCPGCRRFMGASSGTWATTSCARSSGYPTRLPTSSVTPTPLWL